MREWYNDLTVKLLGIHIKEETILGILYVIGNGFDIAHGLQTSYWNFREFLEEHDWQFLENFEKIYGFPQVDVNDPYTNVTAWRNYLYDYLWGSLEEKMSLVDTDDIV
ncbi:MAG: hypothetical protein IJ461_01930, partial [Clostridia bacterium]|nr:hypothetical protein [Clostridia bacterium]